MPKGDKLTPREEFFVREYVVDYNATQAAIRAGYTENSARTLGPRLLSKVGIQQAITEKQKAVAKRNDVTIDRIIQEYAKIAFSDPRKFYTPDGKLKNIADLGDEEAGALASFEQDDSLKKIKLWDKTKGLESLGKHLGMFKELIEIEVSADEAFKELVELAKAKVAERKQRTLPAPAAELEECDATA